MKKNYIKPNIQIINIVAGEVLLQHSGWKHYDGNGWSVMGLEDEDGGVSGWVDGKKVWSPTGWRYSTDWLYYPDD